MGRSGRQGIIWRYLHGGSVMWGNDTEPDVICVYVPRPAVAALWALASHQRELCTKSQEYERSWFGYLRHAGVLRSGRRVVGERAGGVGDAADRGSVGIDVLSGLIEGG